LTGTAIHGPDARKHNAAQRLKGERLFAAMPGLFALRALQA
jgi:hypothetical protein